MKATQFEFRFRFLLHGLLYAIGFVAPWNYAIHYDTIRTWQLLAAMVSRNGWMGFSGATTMFLVVGIVLATAAATLRTWGGAYLGAGVVQDGALHGDQIVAAGPYRYLRNPLYVGTLLHTLALSLLMPPSGAVFSILTIGLFQLRLIGAEEAFLTAKLGDRYLAYKSAVPSLLPALRARMEASATRPAWFTAFLGEIYMWGVAASFAIVGGRYNSQLVLQGVIISLGVSIIARAFVMKK